MISKATKIYKVLKTKQINLNKQTKYKQNKQTKTNKQIKKIHLYILMNLRMSLNKIKTR